VCWTLTGSASLHSQTSTSEITGSPPAPSSSGASSSAPAIAPTSSLAGAREFYRLGNLQAAETAYKAVIQNDPRSAPAYAGLTHLYLKQKRLADASVSASKALEVAPQMSAGHVAMGEVYFRQGQIIQAENEFLTEVKRGTKDARAYLGLARLYSSMSLFARAKRMSDKAYELDPKDPEILRFWLARVSDEDQTTALDNYLKDPANDSAESRKDFEEELALRRRSAAQPDGSCRLRTNLAPATLNLIPLLSRVGHVAGVGLTAKINGTSATLLLDTGASGILIDQGFAEKAGVKRVVKSQFEGIGDRGAAKGYVGFADVLKFGDVEFQGCYVAVVDKRLKSASGENGLIGADVFSDFLVDIDFPNTKLKLTQLPARPGQTAAVPASIHGKSEAPHFYDQYIAPEMKSYAPVFRFGHGLLIPTKVNNSAPVFFFIDSGSFDDLISPAFARQVTKVHLDTDTTVRGINGEVNKVYRADVVNLQFASFRHEREGLVSLDLTSVSDDLGVEVSGMFGFAMLRLMDMKIDYRDGLVDFQFDPNRFH
jgi:tetratricopeptide (TPR) repeat protein